MGEERMRKNKYQEEFEDAEEEEEEGEEEYPLEEEEEEGIEEGMRRRGVIKKRAIEESLAQTEESAVQKPKGEERAVETPELDKDPKRKEEQEEEEEEERATQQPIGQ